MLLFRIRYFTIYTFANVVGRLFHLTSEHMTGLLKVKETTEVKFSSPFLVSQSI